MEIKTYSIENGKYIRLKKSGWLPDKEYKKVHSSQVILCHDVLIHHAEGFLLVKRKAKPAKDHVWAIGGRVIRGMPIMDSLSSKVEEECGLNLTDAMFVGVARTFFKTDPFGHGAGTDSLNLMFIARGEGELKLNDSAYDPLYLNSKNYPGIRKKLHPYIRDFCDLAVKYL